MVYECTVEICAEVQKPIWGKPKGMPDQSNCPLLFYSVLSHMYVPIIIRLVQKHQAILKK